MADARQSAQHTDYNLHGAVGIRLLDARPADVAVITRQLNAILKQPLSGPPDITIRFVDRLPTSSRVRLIGVDDAGFTDDAFLILRSKHKSAAKVQIPFAQIGQQPCEIVVERGLPAVPHLIAIINLTMTAKGILPLHASAFNYRGTGALATGWAKGGKTEVLLAFAAHGAQYIGDEWVYLTRDGQMSGIPEPVRLWKWHLDEMPQYWAGVKRADRLRLRGLALLVRTLERLSTNSLSRRVLPSRLMRRALPILKRQLNVLVPPTRLFEGSTAPAAGTLQRIFFVASHEFPETLIEPVDSLDIARRMAFSLQEERADFMSTYLKFRFAFPDQCNELIDHLEQREHDLLMAALANKQAYAIYHPYPAAIAAFYNLINPLFE